MASEESINRHASYGHNPTTFRIEIKQEPMTVGAFGVSGIECFRCGKQRNRLRNVEQRKHLAMKMGKTITSPDAVGNFKAEIDFRCICQVELTKVQFFDTRRSPLLLPYI